MTIKARGDFNNNINNIIQQHCAQNNTLRAQGKQRSLIARMNTDRSCRSCSPKGSRNLINLIAHFVRSMYSVIYCHRSLFRHDANAMTIHRYAIKAHLI